MADTTYFTGIDSSTTAAAGEYAKEFITDVTKLNPITLGVIAANASANKMTPQQYLESRGGVSSTGAYGDTPAWYYTPETEYRSYFGKGGGGVDALNKATTNRQVQNYLDTNPGATKDEAVKYLLSTGTKASDLGLTDAEAKSIVTPASAVTSGGGSTVGGAVSGGYDASGNYVGVGGAYNAQGAYVGTGSTVSTSAQQNAIANLNATFAKYGLSSLAPKITEFVKMGYSSDTVALLLQDTEEYKKRFAGNIARGKAGLPVLSPAEYISAENAYRMAMRNAGLPSGFYDSEDDFSTFIANDVSATELNARLQSAADAISGSDPYYAQTLQRMYGLSIGDMVAYSLDPEKALPLVQRRANAVNYATAAAQQGLTVDTKTAEYFGGDIGVSEAQARSGFQAISSALPTYEKLTEIYGEMPTAGGLGDLQSATFGGAGSAEAQRRLRRVAQAEQSAFSGSSGVGQTTLGAQPLAGTL